MLVIGLQGSFKSLNLWEIQSKNNFVCEKAVIRIRVIARSGLWASGSSMSSWCHGGVGCDDCDKYMQVLVSGLENREVN